MTSRRRQRTIRATGATLARAMLSFLDGAHDRAAVAAELSVLARTEPLADDNDGRRAGSDRWREDIDGSLERMVRFLQRSALLVS